MWAGFEAIYAAAPDKFAMILDKGHPEYMNLPGIGVLVGGMWVANIYYWGFNQYIIQRTLAAKSLKESQRGILFAAGLKLILPLIVVIPGIAAYVMTQDAAVMTSLGEAAAISLPRVRTLIMLTLGCFSSCPPDSRGWPLRLWQRRLCRLWRPC